LFLLRIVRGAGKSFLWLVGTAVGVLVFAGIFWVLGRLSFFEVVIVLSVWTGVLILLFFSLDVHYLLKDILDEMKNLAAVLDKGNEGDDDL
jgi:hypothetical protein